MLVVAKHRTKYGEEARQTTEAVIYYTIQLDLTAIFDRATTIRQHSLRL